MLNNIKIQMAQIKNSYSRGGTPTGYKKYPRRGGLLHSYEARKAPKGISKDYPTGQAALYK